jgi:hypothetical protein
MSSIVQASTIDRYILGKAARPLFPKWQVTDGEFDLPVGELSPAIDDFLVPALRHIIDDVTDRETRRLQRQRECLKQSVIFFDCATFAKHTIPIR